MQPSCPPCGFTRGPSAKNLEFGKGVGVVTIKVREATEGTELESPHSAGDVFALSALREG